MRGEFVGELVALAEADERVMLLIGDLGFMVLEEFQRRFPERFVNCGVAPGSPWWIPAPRLLDRLREGGDAVILAIGLDRPRGDRATELLATNGIEVAVALVSSFNPSPVDGIAVFLSDMPAVLTVKAHYLDGGFGALVAEAIAERGLACRLLHAGVARMPGGETGSQRFLEDRHGLAPPPRPAAQAGAGRVKIEAVIVCHREVPAVPVIHGSR